MGLKKCPVCGADNSELAKFCYSCGADLDIQQQPSAYDQLVAEYQPQYQEAQAQEVPPSAVAENHPEHPQGAPYTQDQYQAPPQSTPYPQGQYQAPPQSAPYSQGQYQVPPQGVPYGQPIMNPIPYGYKQKSKLAAGLLGILIGSFGVHNFYLGYTGKAVAQLLITLLTCGAGAVISGIWALIEGIMILTGSINVDGKNVPLTD